MGKGSLWTKTRRTIAAYYVFYARILFGLNGCDEHHSLKAEQCFMARTSVEITKEDQASLTSRIRESSTTLILVSYNEHFSFLLARLFSLSTYGDFGLCLFLLIFFLIQGTDASLTSLAIGQVSFKGVHCHQQCYSNQNVGIINLRFF